MLLGRNDSGKSSLLRSVQRDLAGGHYEQVPAEDRGATGGVFFASSSDDELARLINEAAELRRRQKEERKWYVGQRPPYGRGRWWSSFTPPEKGDAPTAWLEAMRAETHSPDFEHVVAELEQSRILGLEPAGVHDNQRVWNVYWCLPAFDELPKEARMALAASDISPYREKREQEKASEKGRRWHTTGFNVPFYGNPRHLWVRGAPVVVSAIGQSLALQVPLGLAVPTDYNSLRLEVAKSLNDLVSAARHGMSDARREESLTEQEAREREAPGNWLED